MAEYITVATGDGSFGAYIARPASLPAPAIVVLQEIFGVNADVRATCDELAKQGYLAISPDLFWRMQPGVDLSDQREDEWRQAFDFFTRFDRERGVLDVNATLDLARRLPGATGKVGLMGFCVGGMMAFVATARKGADASVVYYGAEIDSYLDEVQYIVNPLMIHLAEDDEYVPPHAQRAIVDALQDHAFSQVFSYPGRCHGFASRCGRHYDPGAATLANIRTMTFFNTILQPRAN